MQAAERGAWVEFDGIGPKNIERHVTITVRMKAAGLLGRILLRTSRAGTASANLTAASTAPTTRCSRQSVPP